MEATYGALRENGAEEGGRNGETYPWYGEWNTHAFSRTTMNTYRSGRGASRKHNASSMRGDGVPEKRAGYQGDLSQRIAQR